MAIADSSELSPRSTNEVGQRYGILTVIAFAGRSTSGDSLWLCRCDCGTETTVARGDLRKSYGGAKSCGCGRKTQGVGYGTPEYIAWKEMKRRCYNTKNVSYKSYGGRGISVCDRWRTSFVNFLADMGKRPSPDTSIDRRQRRKLRAG